MNKQQGYVCVYVRMKWREIMRELNYRGERATMNRVNNAKHLGSATRHTTWEVTNHVTTTSWQEPSGHTSQV